MSVLSKTGVVWGVCFALVAGCGEQGQGGKPASSGPAQSDHHAGDGHEHGGDSHGHGHEGQAHALGKVTAAGVTIEATQFGAIEAGGEGIFELAADKPLTALRVWVGVASAEGSVKVLAEKEGKGYDAHLELPKPLLEGSKLWVEVEADGKQETASFTLK